MVGPDIHEVTALVDGEGPDGSSLGVWVFDKPVGVIEARDQADLAAACAQIDQVSQSHHVILAADYEVGSWFEPRLNHATQKHTWAPFQAWLFKEARWLDQTHFDDWFTLSLRRAGLYEKPAGVAGIRAEISQAEYMAAVESALQYIAAGEVYQLNLTWRIDFAYFGQALALYCKLRHAQPVNYGACILFPDRSILSLSPELFLKRCGDRLTARPMKGTKERSGGDKTDAAALQQSTKDRAENLMIVDLIRNDLGRIAELGSVKVEQLFAIEQYPTVYQMVSQVSARVPRAPLLNILQALFPSGSVTGAPKIRAMEIIGMLEQSARGIYTGTIGHIKPGGDFQFNVAIRTLELTPEGRGRLQVGSGIVADSSPSSEYAECWSKARFLTKLPSDFALLETLLLNDGELKRLDAHLERMKESARFFGFTFSESTAKDILLRAPEENPKGQHRIRLTLQPDGRFDLRVQLLSPLPQRLSCVLSPVRTASDDLLLRHKTTARDLYNQTLAHLKGFPTVFDALFFNELGELTEGARTNIFLVKDGTWFTPPVESGLLNGVMRQEILRSREVLEQKLYYQDLVTADEIYLGNALRGLFRVSLKIGPPVCAADPEDLRVLPK